MRKLGTLVGLVAVGAVAALTIGDAVAGNLGSAINPGPGWGPVQSYFSIVMSPTQTLSFTSTNSYYMLVDDITYSADLRPYSAGPGYGSRVVAFAFSELYGVEEVYGTPNPNPFPPTPPMPTFLSFLDGYLFNVIVWDAEKWTNAKGDWFALQLVNNGVGFDRFSHSANIQMVGRQVWFNDVAQTTALGVGMSISQAIVNTSESRHYQTPQICTSGTTVTATLPSGASPYTNALIYIKGRVVNTLATPPAVNTDVTVQ
jgi:hypothetical protein